MKQWPKKKAAFTAFYCSLQALRARWGCNLHLLTLVFKYEKENAAPGASPRLSMPVHLPWLWCPRLRTPVCGSSRPSRAGSPGCTPAPCCARLSHKWWLSSSWVLKLQKLRQAPFFFQRTKSWKLLVMYITGGKTHWTLIMSQEP